MMIEKIGKAAMLEMLGEESSELAQAALKLARKIRGVNPTPKTTEECEKNLVEEWTDVYLCASELNLEASNKIIKEKQDRFQERWNKASGRTEGDWKKWSDSLPKGFLDRQAQINASKIACNSLADKVYGRVTDDKRLRADILDEAKKTVCQDRNDQYGEPEDNFGEIAKYWTDYLGVDISAWDVASMMMLMKIARLKNDPIKKDTWVDIAGYAGCGGEVAAKKAGVVKPEKVEIKSITTYDLYFRLNKGNKMDTDGFFIKDKGKQDAYNAMEREYNHVKKILSAPGSKAVINYSWIGKTSAIILYRPHGKDDEQRMYQLSIIAHSDAVIPTTDKMSLHPSAGEDDSTIRDLYKQIKQITKPDHGRYPWGESMKYTVKRTSTYSDKTVTEDVVWYTDDKDKAVKLVEDLYNHRLALLKKMGTTITFNCFNRDAGLGRIEYKYFSDGVKRSYVVEVPELHKKSHVVVHRINVDSQITDNRSYNLRRVIFDHDKRVSKDKEFIYSSKDKKEVQEHMLEVAHNKIDKLKKKGYKIDYTSDDLNPGLKDSFVIYYRRPKSDNQLRYVLTIEVF